MNYWSSGSHSHVTNDSWKVEFISRPPATVHMCTVTPMTIGCVEVYVVFHIISFCHVPLSQDLYEIAL